MYDKYVHIFLYSKLITLELKHTFFFHFNSLSSIDLTKKSEFLQSKQPSTKFSYQQKFLKVVVVVMFNTYIRTGMSDRRIDTNTTY